MAGLGVHNPSGRKAPWRRVSVVLAMLVGLTGIAACGDDGARQVSSADPSAGLALSAAPQAPQGAASPTLVYFGWNENVGTAGRPDDTATLEGAIAALLQGPDAFETDIGMATEIPEATTLLGVSVSGGTAVVDLSEAFQSGGGSLSMQLRVAQVVFTATQFDEVERVTIKLDGQAVDSIGGEGVPAVDLDRTDFTNVTPAVLVESPTPGASVASPLKVSGIANTFEAVVSYTIADGDGLIVDEGVTNASAGTGTYGDFEFTSTFGDAKPGLGAVIAYQESAKDGSPTDVYEVPVRFGASTPEPPSTPPTPTTPEPPGTPEPPSSAENPSAVSPPARPPVPPVFTG